MYRAMVKFWELSTRTPHRVIGVILLLIVLVGGADYVTGYEFDVEVFYLAPVALASWFLGGLGGILTSCASVLMWVTANDVLHQYQVSIPGMLWNSLVLWVFFAIVSRMLIALKSSMERETKMARTDFKTGIANAMVFYERAELEIHRARRNRHPLSVFYIDCDNFKGINDGLGHHTGDEVLRTVASTLKEDVRVTDLVARMGGDEFCILLPETDAPGACLVAQRVNRKFNDVMTAKGYRVTLSIGVVTFMTPPGSVDHMVKMADDMMYSAKNDGKNAIRTVSID